MRGGRRGERGGGRGGGEGSGEREEGEGNRNKVYPVPPPARLLLVSPFLPCLLVAYQQCFNLEIVFFLIPSFSNLFFIWTEFYPLKGCPRNKKHLQTTNSQIPVISLNTFSLVLKELTRYKYIISSSLYNDKIFIKVFFRGGRCD